MTITTSEADPTTLLLRRLIDQSKPAESPIEVFGGQRQAVRFVRILPVLVVPIKNRIPDIERAVYVLCRDLSERGISLIHTEHLTRQDEDLVIGLCHADGGQPTSTDSAVLLKGRCKFCQQFGGGFLQTGIEFLSVYEDATYRSGLEVLVKGVVPPHMLNEQDRQLIGV